MRIGLPRMHKERGELRDFLPGFVTFAGGLGAEAIVVEDGYGSGMGFRAQNYLRASPVVRLGTYAEASTQDVVIVLRAPAEDALRMMRRGSVILAMFHYPTNPHRTRLLAELGLHAVSLDSLVDDRGRRLVEDVEAVGWNGLETAFRELARAYPRFEDLERGPIRVTVLGTGAVAGAAAFAAARYGDHDLRARMVARGVPGVETTLVDYDLTSDGDYMTDRLSVTDVLVDATRRPVASKPAVENRLVGFLPEHAVIVDLAADPYDLSSEPPVVKGIEGVPHGTLDKYVFPRDDAAYDALTGLVDTTHRRVAVSCYSWPGIHPRASMEHYGGQLESVLEVVLSKSPDRWDVQSENHAERAVARAEVTRWMRAADLSR